jgi:hypothetical protein
MIRVFSTGSLAYLARTALCRVDDVEGSRRRAHQDKRRAGWDSWGAFGVGGGTRGAPFTCAAGRRDFLLTLIEIIDIRVSRKRTSRSK